MKDPSTGRPASWPRVEAGPGARRGSRAPRRAPGPHRLRQDVLGARAQAPRAQRGRAGHHGGRPKAVDGDMLTFAVAVDKGLPLRLNLVGIRQPGEPLKAEEVDLRERLQAQPHPNTALP